MPRRAPDVVSGPRGPEAFPQRREDEAPQPAQFQKASSVERVFQAKYPNLRVQIRTEPDQFIGGRVYHGRNVAAQFENGLFRTTDPEIIEVLEKGRNYGIGRDYWDAEQLAREAAVAERRQARELLLKNKDVIRDMVKSGELKASDLEDFALSEATA